MAPCMGPMSPVRAYSLWAGLCPEKLVKPKKKNKKTKLSRKDETLTQVSLTIYSVFLNQNYPKYISVAVSKILEGKKKNYQMFYLNL